MLVTLQNSCESWQLVVAELRFKLLRLCVWYAYGELIAPIVQSALVLGDDVWKSKFAANRSHDITWRSGKSNRIFIWGRPIVPQKFQVKTMDDSGNAKEGESQKRARNFARILSRFPTFRPEGPDTLKQRGTIPKYFEDQLVKLNRRKTSCLPTWLQRPSWIQVGSPGSLLKYSHKGSSMSTNLPGIRSSSFTAYLSWYLRRCVATTCMA